MDDFIEVYDDALAPEFCEQVIARFEASPRVGPGRTGHGVDLAKKNSLDLTLTGEGEWHESHDALLEASFRHLVKYVRKYPYVLTGALALSTLDPHTGRLSPIAAESIARLDDSMLGSYVFRVFRPGVLNLQKYLAGSGGYHYWHSEIYPRDAQCETLHRVLLFMFYLNDVAEGGETEFYYQRRKLTPRRGSMVIAPAGFTHTHKGHVPISHDKYIATSWFLFQRAERLYENHPPQS